MEPTVYYENAQGQRLYPWDSRVLPSQYTQQGYERVEVSGVGAIRKLERQINNEMVSEHARQAEHEAITNEAERRARHDSLRHDMQQMDTFTRDLAQHAMDEENRGSGQRYDPEAHIGGWN